MEKKNNKCVYTLRICFNPDTDEIEYIAEGIDDDFDFTPINPQDFTTDTTPLLTPEDMELIKKLYELEDN
tara:strand:- start:3123 stop:3332 length:210 start_codon:yes stop_codon:yes gene_type:complete